MSGCAPVRRSLNRRRSGCAFVHGFAVQHVRDGPRDAHAFLTGGTRTHSGRTPNYMLQLFPGNIARRS